MQTREKARLAEIIKKVNDLFSGDVTDGDTVVYLLNVLPGKLQESVTLQQQALANTPAQFAASPDLTNAITDAIIASHDAHTAMSTQALNSESIRERIKDILLNDAGLYELLRATAQVAARTPHRHRHDRAATASDLRAVDAILPAGGHGSRPIHGAAVGGAGV